MKMRLLSSPSLVETRPATSVDKPHLLLHRVPAVALPPAFARDKSSISRTVRSFNMPIVRTADLLQLPESKIPRQPLQANPFKEERP